MKIIAKLPITERLIIAVRKAEKEFRFGIDYISLTEAEYKELMDDLTPFAILYPVETTDIDKSKFMGYEIKIEDDNGESGDKTRETDT